MVEARDKLQQTDKALYTKREKLILKDLGVLDRALQYFKDLASIGTTPTTAAPPGALLPPPHPS